MAYSVNQDFTNGIYSGSSQYRAKLIIGEEEIPNSQISSISISSPIVDSGSDYFYVGSFISQKITIKFRNLDDYNFVSGEEVSLSISQKVNNQWIEVPIGKYLIDDLAENYHKTCEITCMDYAIKFKPNIDYSPCFVNNRATIGTILNYICNYFGVELGVYPLTNDDVVVATYNNTVSGKQWISYIAELKGCNAKIDRTGKLTFKPLTTAITTTINAKKGSEFELGEKYKISKVTYFDAIRNYTYGTDTNNTLFIRQDNPFINDTSVVENIFNVVNGYETYNAKAKNYGDFTLDAWDIIGYQVDGNTYNVINNNTITYAMSIMGEVNVSIPTKQQEVTTNVIEPNLKTVSATVDNVNKSVSLVVNEIGDRTGKTTSITQDIDHIEGLISEVVDVTTSSETQVATLTFEETINQSQPIEVKIQPISDNISYLYPNEGLFPSDTLFPKERKLIFSNIDTEENFIWELPTNLWIYSNEIYDELYLTYGDGTNPIVTVTRRCKPNSDGTISALETPTTETYPYPNIELTEGHYTVTLIGYNSAYLYVRLMVKNIYTSQFATRVELNSAIEQTSQSIMTEVRETYATQAEANSLSTRIKQTAKNVAITATDNNTSCGINVKLYNEDGTKIDEKEANITMSGLVKFTDLSESGSTTINGANITTGIIKGITLQSTNYVANTSGTKINLADGTIDTKNFKVSSDGSITANNGTFTGNINGSAISGGTISGSSISGGEITLSSTGENNPKLKVISAYDSSRYLDTYYGGLRIFRDGMAKVSLNGQLSSGMVGVMTNDNEKATLYPWGVVVSSDIRFKENIKNIDEKTSLNIITSLNPINYNYKETKKIRRGLSAQEVEKVMLENKSKNQIYQINEDGRYSLNYTEFIPDLINCIKYQQKEIEELKEEIKTLKESDK